MSFEYIIANIKIPIQVFENGTTSAITERIHVEIEKCNELPEIQDNYNKTFLDKLSLFLHKPEAENPVIEKSDAVTKSEISPSPRIFITKEEIQSYSKKQSRAVTFKHNRHKKAKRMTLKNYFIGKPFTANSDADSDPSPMEPEQPSEVDPKC